MKKQKNGSKMPNCKLSAGKWKNPSFSARCTPVTEKKGGPYMIIFKTKKHIQL
jgi:hypothetical protein